MYMYNYIVHISPWVQQTMGYPLVLEHTLCTVLPQCIFCSLSQPLQFSFFVPPGTHYCWRTGAVWIEKFAQHFFSWPMVESELQTFWFWVLRIIHYDTCSHKSIFSDNFARDSAHSPSWYSFLIVCSFLRRRLRLLSSPSPAYSLKRSTMKSMISCSFDCLLRSLFTYK